MDANTAHDSDSCCVGVRMLLHRMCVCTCALGFTDAGEWLLPRQFREAMLKAVAERVLLVLPQYSTLRGLPLRGDGEMAAQPWCLPHTVRLCASHDDEASESVARTLAHFFPQRIEVLDNFVEALASGALNMSFPRARSFELIGRRSDTAAATGSAFLVLVLNERSFVGEASDAVADDVRAALSHDVGVLVVHERRHGRGACEFDRFLATCPRDLQQRGIFDKLAVPYHDAPFTLVSIALLLQAVGAKPQWRRQRNLCWRLQRLLASCVTSSKRTAKGSSHPTSGSVDSTYPSVATEHVLGATTTASSASPAKTPAVSAFISPRSARWQLALQREGDASIVILRERMDELEGSATLVQASYRGLAVRTGLANMTRAAIRLQLWFHRAGGDHGTSGRSASSRSASRSRRLSRLSRRLCGLSQSLDVASDSSHSGVVVQNPSVDGPARGSQNPNPKSVRLAVDLETFSARSSVGDVMEQLAESSPAAANAGRSSMQGCAPMPRHDAPTMPRREAVPATSDAIVIDVADTAPATALAQSASGRLSGTLASATMATIARSVSSDEVDVSRLRSLSAIGRAAEQNMLRMMQHTDEPGPTGASTQRHTFQDPIASQVSPTDYSRARSASTSRIFYNRVSVAARL